MDKVFLLEKWTTGDLCPTCECAIVLADVEDDYALVECACGRWSAVA